MCSSRCGSHLALFLGGDCARQCTCALGGESGCARNSRSLPEPGHLWMPSAGLRPRIDSDSNAASGASRKVAARPKRTAFIPVCPPPPPPSKSTRPNQHVSILLLQLHQLLDPIPLLSLVTLTQLCRRAKRTADPAAPKLIELKAWAFRVQPKRFPRLIKLSKSWASFPRFILSFASKLRRATWPSQTRTSVRPYRCAPERRYPTSLRLGR